MSGSGEVTRISVKAKPKARTYYQVLGVTPSATFEQIHAAYLTLAKQLHPDKVKNKEEEFKELALAYSHLKTEVSRRAYNIKLKMERDICPRCVGRGSISGFVGKKYLKDVSCMACRATGYL